MLSISAQIQMQISHYPKYPTNTNTPLLHKSISAVVKRYLCTKRNCCKYKYKYKYKYNYYTSPMLSISAVLCAKRNCCSESDEFKDLQGTGLKMFWWLDFQQCFQFQKICSFFTDGKKKLLSAIFINM